MAHFYTRLKLEERRAAGVLVSSLVAQLFLCSAIMGCYDLAYPIDIKKESVAHALHQMESCQELELYAKEAAITRMKFELKASLDEELEYLNDRGWGMFEDAVADFASEDPALDSGSNGAEYSETNLQEAGVDEADLVKTDGSLLYVLGRGELVLVQAGEGGSLESMGRVALGGYAKELMLYKDQVIVFSEPDEAEIPESIRRRFEEENEWEEDDAEGSFEDGYDSGGVSRGNRNFTQVSIIDVSDPTFPTLVRRTIYEGTYVTSRRMDHVVRVVLSSNIPAFDVETWVWVDTDKHLLKSQKKAALYKAYAELLEENTAQINRATLEDILPKKVKQISSQEFSQPKNILECQDVLSSLTTSGDGLTSVISINLSEPTHDQPGAGVFGQTGVVYASTQSLYLATPRQFVTMAISSGGWDDESSGIHKFDISSATDKIVYRGTGVVPGRLLDQFCLGEHEGYLRVATSTGWAWAWDRDRSTLDNHLMILQERDQRLEIVSQIDGIGIMDDGRHEEIYAARFQGNRGYIVTFLQTDPLYTFDLSDPDNPRLMGEWLGPGYSTYLHPVGEDHILSVGQEDWRIHVSLYDISNFSKPELVTRFLFADNMYGSPALDDHRAFTYFKSTLALPYSGWTDPHFENNGGYATGVSLFDISLTGITNLGQLQFGSSSPHGVQAERTIFIDDYVYAYSRCELKSAALSNPGLVLDTQSLFSGDQCESNDHYYYD